MLNVNIVSDTRWSKLASIKLRLKQTKTTDCLKACSFKRNACNQIHVANISRKRLHTHKQRDLLQPR